MYAKSLQSCPTLWESTGCSPLGSSVHGILQARILEWVAISSSKISSRPRDRTSISYASCIGRWILYIYNIVLCVSVSVEREQYSVYIVDSLTLNSQPTAQYSCVCTQSCPTLWDSMDCSLTGSSVHGIFLARILEWVAIFYSRGFSQSMDWTFVSYVSYIVRRILYHCTTWE